MSVMPVRYIYINSSICITRFIEYNFFLCYCAHSSSKLQYSYCYFQYFQYCPSRSFYAVIEFNFFYLIPGIFLNGRIYYKLSIVQTRVTLVGAIKIGYHAMITTNIHYCINTRTVVIYTMVSTTGKLFLYCTRQYSSYYGSTCNINRATPDHGCSGRAGGGIIFKLKHASLGSDRLALIVNDASTYPPANGIKSLKTLLQYYSQISVFASCGVTLSWCFTFCCTSCVLAFDRDTCTDGFSRSSSLPPRRPTLFPWGLRSPAPPPAQQSGMSPSRYSKNIQVLIVLCCHWTIILLLEYFCYSSYSIIKVGSFQLVCDVGMVLDCSVVPKSIFWIVVLLFSSVDNSPAVFNFSSEQCTNIVFQLSQARKNAQQTKAEDKLLREKHLPNVFPIPT